MHQCYHPLVLPQEQEPESPDHAAAGQHRRRGEWRRGQVPQRLLQPRGRGRGRGCRGGGGGGAAGGAAGRPAGGAGAAAGRGAAAARTARTGTSAGHTHTYLFIIYASQNKFDFHS